MFNSTTCPPRSENYTLIESILKNTEKNLEKHESKFENLKSLIEQFNNTIIIKLDNLTKLIELNHINRRNEIMLQTKYLEEKVMSQNMGLRQKLDDFLIKFPNQSMDLIKEEIEKKEKELIDTLNKWLNNSANSDINKTLDDIRKTQSEIFNNLTSINLKTNSVKRNAVEFNPAQNTISIIPNNEENAQAAKKRKAQAPLMQRQMPMQAQMPMQMQMPMPMEMDVPVQKQN